MVNMSSGFVDADKLSLSVAAALLATEYCNTFVISLRTMRSILPNDFCKLSFSLLFPTELQIDFIMSRGSSSFYDFKI